jgi:hypothetical protein
MEADISIWQKPGHFYFALTRWHAGAHHSAALTVRRYFWSER